MRPIRCLLAGLVVVSVAFHGCSPDEAPQASNTGQLKVMTFNIGRSDAPVSADQVATAIRTAGADIVGLQESDGNERRIAEILGWDYADERLHLVSRFPLFPIQHNGVALAYAEVAAGRVVAIANTHLPADRPGSKPVDDRAAMETAVQRIAMLKPIATVLPALASDKVPVFLTGNFNAPSHLDQPEAANKSSPTSKYKIERFLSKLLSDSGFTDSYRAVHADPAAKPGVTWTSGHPDPTLGSEGFDRIDFVYSAGPAKAIDSKVVGEAEAQGSGQAEIGIDGWPSDHRAVISTFEIDSAPMPQMVIVDPAIVAPGDVITVRVAGQEREETGVIGIYRPGKPETEPAITSQPPQEDDQPTATFGTVRLAPGRYIAAYADSAGKRLSSTEFEVRPSSRARIQVKTASINPGDPIEVAWRNAPGNRLDWIGLYKAEEPNLLSYLARLDTSMAINGQATFTFEAFGDNLQPGKYEARLMRAGGYVELASTKLVVSNPNAKPQVNVPVVRIKAGDPLTVSWKDSPGNDKDYIGLYKADEPDLHRYLTYLYTEGKIDGSVTFKSPTFAKAPGEYVARLMINDGYNELASTRFWVTFLDGMPQVSVGNAKINPGEPIEIRWTSAPAGQRTLIRIHKAGDTGFNQILAQRVGASAATDGQLIFKAEDFSTTLEPGDYKVRMMREDGSEELASTQFTVPNPNAVPQVIAPKDPVKSGDPIVVSWKNSPGNRHDWIGLYKASTTNTHQYIAWLYTDGALDGTVTFSAERSGSMLPPGEYKASLLVDNGYDDIASATFTVGGPASRTAAVPEGAPATPCDLPKPGAGHLLAVLGAHSGEFQPNVTVAGQDAATGLMLVRIELGEQPLYLFLISSKPTIWQLEGATDRIAHVVAVRSDDTMPEVKGVGVVGVHPDKVTFLPPNSCGGYFTKADSREAQALGDAIERSVGRQPDAIQAVFSARKVAMPSGHVIAKNKIRNLVITGDKQISVQGNFTVVRGDSVADLITIEDHLAPPSSLVSVDPLAVAAADKAEPYEMLPGAYGLRQLVEAGQLERTDAGYRIVKPISRFPGRLTGAGAPTFILPDGMPMPMGDTGLNIIKEQAAQ